jgi:hypothetical protein
VIEAVVNEEYEEQLDLSLRIVHVYVGRQTLLGESCKASGINFEKEKSTRWARDRYLNLHVGDTVICFLWRGECVLRGAGGGKTYSHFNSLVKLAAQQGKTHFSRAEAWAETVEALYTRVQDLPPEKQEQEMLTFFQERESPEILAWKEGILDRIAGKIELNFLWDGALVKAKTLSAEEQEDGLHHTLQVLHVYKGKAALLGQTIRAMSNTRDNCGVMGGPYPITPPPSG